MSNFYIEKPYYPLDRYGVDFFYQTFEGDKLGCVIPHIHPAVELLFIDKGNFLVSAGGIEFEAGEGRCVVFCSESIHQLRQLQCGSSYYVLKLTPGFISALSEERNLSDYLLSLSPARKGCFYIDGCFEGELGFYLSKLIANLRGEEYCADIIKSASAGGILATVLREISCEKTSQGSFANQRLTDKIYAAISYINEHYSEDISVEDLSRLSMMSYGYFAKRFKAVTGKSFREYLMQIRCDRAKRALLTTEKPITEIGLECGFGSHAYFTASYKRCVGETPSASRKSRLDYIKEH